MNSEIIADDLTISEIETLLELMIMPFFKYILTRNDYDGHYDSGFSTDMMIMTDIMIQDFLQI